MHQNTYKIRKKDDEGNIIFKDLIFLGTPVKITYFPKDRVYRIQWVYEGVLETIEGTLSEVIKEMKENKGFIPISENKATELFIYLIEELKETGNSIYTVSEERIYKGIFLEGDEIRISGYEPKPIDMERLKKEVGWIKELSNYYPKRKYYAVLYYILSAPFGHIFREKGKVLTPLWVVGETGTGKTTLINTLSTIWEGVEQNPQTIAQLTTFLSQNHIIAILHDNYLLSKGTKEEEIDSILQNLSDTELVKKYASGKAFHSYSTVIISSNYGFTDNPAVLRRLLKVEFIHRLSKEQIYRFDMRWKPYTHKRNILFNLSEIRNAILNLIEEEKITIEDILQSEDMIQFGKKIALKLNEVYGVDIPIREDVRYTKGLEHIEEKEEEILDIILSKIKKDINKMKDNIPIEERIKNLHYVEVGRDKGENTYIYITSTFIKELRRNENIKIHSLKQLANILMKRFRDVSYVTPQYKRRVKIPLNDLYLYLTLEEEGEVYYFN
jgi:hypothetical protein